jgi:tetratricopeptide (TPR) repeat protein
VVGILAAGLYVRLLVQGRDHAVEKQQIAGRGRLRALEAVHKMLAVARDDLENIPETEAVRRGLLEQAVALCEKLQSDEPGDPALRLQLGQIWIVLGDLYRRLGALGIAEQAQERAVDMLSALATEHPDNPDYRAELAASYQNLALGQCEQTRFAEAEVHYREGLRQLEPGDSPRDIRYRAHIQGNLAVLCQTMGRLPECRAFYEQAIASLESLPPPLTAPDRQRLAMDYDQLAVARADAGEAKPAKDLFDRACVLRQALVKEAPHDARRQHDLAASRTNLGEWYFRFQPDAMGLRQAEEHCLSAREINQSLARRFHRFPRYKAALVDNHLNLAGLYERQGRFPLVVESLTEGLKTADELARAYPEVVSFHKLLQDAAKRLAVESSQHGLALAAGKVLSPVASAWQKLAAERESDQNVRATRDCLLEQCRKLQTSPSRAE